MSLNQKQTNKENTHGVEKSAVKQLLLVFFLSPCLCLSSPDRPAVKGEDVCSSHCYSWVSEQAGGVYLRLTVNTFYEAGEKYISYPLCFIIFFSPNFEILFHYTDVQIERNFPFTVCWMMCGNKNVWWHMTIHKLTQQEKIVSPDQVDLCPITLSSAWLHAGV